jgi:hypothetical protein
MESLEVSVAKHRNGCCERSRRFVNLPDEKIYHQIITEQELVRSSYAAISSLETSGGYGNVLSRPDYVYWLRWSRDDRTTLTYTGHCSVNTWELNDTVSTRGVNHPVYAERKDLMDALHTRYGMPYWLAEDSGLTFATRPDYSHPDRSGPPDES